MIYKRSAKSLILRTLIVCIAIISLLFISWEIGRRFFNIDDVSDSQSKDSVSVGKSNQADMQESLKEMESIQAAANGGKSPDPLSEEEVRKTFENMDK